MAKDKLPAFQFYPGDWMKDPSLRSVSSGARGLWIDMLCLMFEAEDRGHLCTPLGRPVTLEALCRMTGQLSLEQTQAWLDELLEAGVYSVEADVIFSRRMVRDEANRLAKVEAGRRGGQANTQAERKQDPKQNASRRPSKSQADPRAESKQTPKQTASKTQAEGQANGKQKGGSSASASASASTSSSKLSSLQPEGGDCEAILRRCGVTKNTSRTAAQLGHNCWLAVRLWAAMDERDPKPKRPAGLMARIAADGDFDELPEIRPSLLGRAIEAGIVAEVNGHPAQAVKHSTDFEPSRQPSGYWADDQLIVAQNAVGEAVLA